LAKAIARSTFEDANERDERHHLLVLDERVFGSRLTKDDLGPLGHVDPRMAAQHSGIPDQSGPC